MLEKIVESAFNNRAWMFLVFGVVALVGVHALGIIPIDAVPDITSVQVMVNTKTGSLDPEQVEKTVSYPIESEMSGIAGVVEVRSISKYGLSQVVVVFSDGTDMYWARQQISERLQSVRENLPEGLSPELAPITTGLGEVLMYAVLPKPGSALEKKSAQERLLALRTYQDYVLRRQLKAMVPNIADVDSTGGYKKEIHIDVDPVRAESQGLSIEDLAGKVETLGESFGGGYIEHQGQQIVVRTVAAIDKMEQIEHITVKLDVQGRPVRLSEVATVREDYVQRLGAATFDGHETVLGTVLMLSGANSRQVARDAQKALLEMEKPQDCEIRILYSRGFLVDATIHTVAKNLGEGAALVVVVLLLILGNLRAALIVSLAIPSSMLLAAIGMKQFGISANLMSLGAVDFGLLVDASIVIVENILRRMEESGAVLRREERAAIVMQSVKDVLAPVSIGLLLIMAVYVPILSLEGVEGKIFHPMAKTVLMALGGSLLVALFLMPAAAYFVLGKARAHAGGAVLFRAIRWVYAPVLRWSLRYRVLVLLPVLAAGYFAIDRYLRMGSDFMPPLDEGDMVINLTRESNIALSQSIALQKQCDKIIAQFGEVEHVFSRIGTPESATDPMGVHLSDTFVILKKDENAWPVMPNGQRRSKDELFHALREALEKGASGQEITQTQPIEMRFNEILEGSRADVTLRIYGSDLDKLMAFTEASRDILEKIPGASEVELDALTALRKSPVLDVKLDYERITRYGLAPEQVNKVLETAMGGRRVGSFYENQWRFPIVLRLAEEFRENPDELSRLPVGLPDRGTVPLSQVATIERKDQVTTIAHQRGERYAGVAINLSGRDTEGFVAEAKRALAEKISLPEGYTLSWGGQFKNLERARARLRVVVPIVLLVILLVLVKMFGNLKQALLVYASIPFAMTGGIFSLHWRGIPLSVSAAVGFIALCGIAILNAMVLVTFFNQLRQRGLTIAQAVTEGALARLRPVLMTALVASLGFLPMALNTGMGSEVQRPLATVVIGGLISATVLTLLVIPMLYAWVERERLE